MKDLLHLMVWCLVVVIDGITALIEIIQTIREVWCPGCEAAIAARRAELSRTQPKADPVTEIDLRSSLLALSHKQLMALRGPGRKGPKSELVEQLLALPAPVGPAPR